MRTPLLTLAALLVCTGGASGQTLVEVAQETTPNAGDFDDNILGTIGSYETALTAEEYYAWDVNGMASFNGPAPQLASNTTQVFFLDGADGLSLVVVHDAVKVGGNDGEAGMRYEVVGDPDGLARTVEDDPNGMSPNDQYTGNAGDSIFTAQQRWFSCCADGSALTGLDGEWTLLVSFSDVDDDEATRNYRNIFFWQARSGDGAVVPLALASDRRVRFRIVPSDSPCGDPEAGDCLTANGTPGCNDEACCETVCGLDPFCCDAEWDEFCVDIAEVNCDLVVVEACCLEDGSCQMVSAGECSEIGGTPQGEGSDCDTAECPAPACPGEGDCFTGNGTPGCADPVCCELVCEADAFCCDTEWDNECAGIALQICPDAPGACPGEGDCFDDENGSPGCNDEACCSSVCAEDAFCCDVVWDGACVALAFEVCDDVPMGTCPGEGDCLEENGTPSCDDVACCEAVCAGDPFCCNVEWDDACVEDALLVCTVVTDQACCLIDGSCQVLPVQACTLSGGTPQGEGTDCTVNPCIVIPETQACCLFGDTCADAFPAACQAGGGILLGPGTSCATAECESTDQACCLPDGSCDDLDPEICGLSGGTPQGEGTVCLTDPCAPDVCPGEGDCLEGNGTVGCENEACCNLVCDDDSFCCDTEWDDICADSAAILCEAVLPRACCFADGSCQDLAIAPCLLAGGEAKDLGTSCEGDGCTPPCPADVNDDGAVNIDDIVAVVITFGDEGEDLPTDVNGDGVVNIDDIVEVITSFGPCPI